MTNVVIDNFKFLNDKGIGVLKEIAKELNIKSLHLYTTKNKLELINLIIKKEPSIEKTQSPPKKVFKCKEDKEINTKTGRCRKKCKEDEERNHKGICIKKSPKKNDKSPFGQISQKKNIDFGIIPYDVKLNILSNLSVSSINNLLSTNKYNNNERKEIKKYLNRIITENEEKINKLIDEIFIIYDESYDINDIYINNKIYDIYIINKLIDDNEYIKKKKLKDKIKKKFIIDYNNAHILKWNSERIYIDSLDLQQNHLTSLPESFGKLIIGSNLGLSKEELENLPERFGNLNLSLNKLKSLPESFGNLKIGGCLDLSNNKLEYLPESFGSIKKIGGKLNLSYNQLESLPENFGSLVIKGYLNLEGNELKLLPESFGKLVIGGELSLAGNNLMKLPESFGEITIGGNLIGVDLDLFKSQSLLSKFIKN